MCYHALKCVINEQRQARGQYTKDKVYRFSFRVNEALYTWAERRAKMLGVTPCDFVRNSLFQQMSAEQVLGNIGNCRRDCEVNDENGKKHQ